MSVARIKKDFKGLSDQEKLRLVQELWDEIENRDSILAVTPEQEAELDARYQRYCEDPTRAIPLAEVQAAFQRRT